MRIISIANFKGGTGKTVTAVNLAALLAREGQRVVLIDADAQHNATDFFLDEGPECTLGEVLQGYGETVWSDNLSETRYEGLRVLGADMDLLRLDLAAIISGADAGDKRLLDFLECAREDEETDFVIIDCPPSFTTASVAALTCSEEVILPTRVDAFSRAGALELIEQVRGIGRYHITPRFRVLVTMTGKNRISAQVTEQLRRDGLDVFRTTIRNSTTVNESSYARAPLYEYCPKNPAAQDYEALLREVLAYG